MGDVSELSKYRGGCALAEGGVRAEEATVAARCDALQMMVQALAYMQEAMKTMEHKMDRTDDTVHTLTKSVIGLQRKFHSLERDVRVILERKLGPSSPHLALPEPHGTDVPAASEHALRGRGDDRDRDRDHDAHRSSGWREHGRGAQGQAVARAAKSYEESVGRPSSLMPSPSELPMSEDDSEPSASATQSLSSSTLPSLESGKTGGRARSPDAARAPVASSRSECDTASPSTAAKRRILLGRNLLTAAQEGNTKEVLKLLKEGADVNFCNRSKMAPLHMAAMRAQAGVVALLLERDANPNARTAFGFTAMHMAAHNDKSGLCVSLLVYAGCDVNCRNQFGRTPLHYAADCGNEAAVRALVAAGASKTAKDDEGRSPFHVAKTNNVRTLLAPPPNRPRSRGRRCRSSVDRPPGKPAPK